MPGATILEIPLHEQAWMLAELRRARYGYRLAPHVLLGVPNVFIRLPTGGGKTLLAAHSISIAGRSY